MKGIEGTTLGRYELRRHIAHGGMSEVYLGYDRRVRRSVAVKVLYGNDKAFVRRFEREALAVGALSHDHILPLYDFGEQRPWYYLVMPYIEGGTLRDYLHVCERLTLAEAGSFLSQIASALQYAHEHGVVHRDVKPSNILLRQDGYAYLVDFGLAKAKIEAEAFSHSGMMIGTPEYMAPEQSHDRYDHRSDIYSLGIVLYQMLTGSVPFTGYSPVAISLKHIQAQPTPPQQVNSAIPPAVGEVILKALAKHPEERYQHATALAIAYHKALYQATKSTSRTMPALASLQTEAQNTPATAPEVASTPSLEETSAPKQTPAVVSEPPLIPLKTKMPSLPSTSPPRSTRRHPLPLIVCCILLILSIPLSLFWYTDTVPHSPPGVHKRHTTSTTPSSAATSTAVAQSREQAKLAAQARVQATAGITSAVGAGNALYGNDMSRPGGGWINDGHQCYFSPQGYYVRTFLAHTAAWCYSSQQTFSNVIITTQAQLLHGDICGLIFDLRPSSKSFYVLEINRHSEYRFVRAQGDNPLGWLTLIDWTYSSAILSDDGQSNTFLVVANSAGFRFYINKQLVVSSFVDNAYSAGLIGLLVGGDSPGGTEAIFKNVWVFQN